MYTSIKLTHAMKNTLMLALCLSVFTFAEASAQTTPTDKPAKHRREHQAALTPEQQAERQTRRLTKHLSLTPDQQTAVAAINLKYAKQMQTLKNDGERSPDRRKQLGDLRRSKEGELKQVFSAEQYKQYVALREENRQKRQHARGRRSNS